MKTCAKFVGIFIASSLLAACSGSSKDWPNLSDPLPQPEERERVIERSSTAGFEPAAEPAAPARPGMTGSVAPAPMTDPVPATEIDANALLDEIKKALREETLAYREAKATFGAAFEEARDDAWFSAQMALTRLSRTASRLDGLMAADMPALAKAAAAEYDIIERFVVAERQQLMVAKP